jgi:predicted metalloprotease
MRYSTIAGQDILVGGFNPSEKYEFVSWEDDIPDIWKNMFQTTIQYQDSCLIAFSRSIRNCAGIA